MKTKLTVLSISLFLSMLPLTLANGVHEEDMSFGHQMEEMMPFMHMGEDHWLSALLSVVLWLAFFYTVYSIFKMLTKKKK